MHARVFRPITKALSLYSKTILLALFVVATVLGVAMPVMAQTRADVIAQKQSLYQNYLTLFTSDSGLVGEVGLIRDASTKAVNGLKFTIALTAARTGNPWAYVKEDGFTTSPNAEETFLIRLCSTANPTQCWLNTIPYDEDNDGISYNAITREHGKGPKEDDPMLSQQISNFSAFDPSHSNGTNVSSGMSGYRYKYARTISGIKNEGTESDFGNGIVFQPSSSVEATLWYCAEDTGIEKGSTAYDGDGVNDTIATFGSLCGGRSYFRIGQPRTVTIPATEEAIAALTNTEASTKEVGDAAPIDNLPECGITGGNAIMGCLAQLVYYALYWPAAWVAGLLGSLFDFFIGYSVADESYRYAFAVDGWRLVRDIANIMFIIIMVYVGFAAVFSFGGSGGTTMRRVVPILIFNALIINFSLFATRTVIDISNITARVFYSRMVVCEGECSYRNGSSTPENIKRGPFGQWPLSEKIVGAFDPQRLFNASILNPQSTVTGSGSPEDRFNNSTAAGKKAEEAAFDQSGAGYAGYYALVSVIAAAIMISIAIMFFNVTFMFVGRVIGLYMAMIFSPLAFLTRGGTPLFSGGSFAWKKWADDLFKYAALAPVFIFFLYIVYSFLNTDIVKQIGVKSEGGGFFGTVLSIVIPMLFIYFLIQKGVEIAKLYAGKFGEMAQSFGTTLSGAALGVATGGAALVGRNVVGRMGARLAGSESLRNMAASGNALTRRIADTGLRAGSALSTASYDLRNSKAGKAIEKETGMRLNNALTNITNTSTRNTAGGFTGAISRTEATITARANRLQTTGARAAALNATNKKWEEAYRADRDAAEGAAMAQGYVFDEVAHRNQYEAAQVQAGNARPLTADEINRQRERSYQAALARGTFLSRLTASDTNRSNAATIAGGSVVGGVAGAAAGVGIAALAGQGEIQDAARANVLRARSAQARDPLSPQQRAALNARLGRLQTDRLRIATNLQPVLQGLAHVSDVNDITVLDVQNYQAAHANHNMASPNTVIAERDRVNRELEAVRTQLGRN